MECYCYLRNVQDLLAEGKTLYERRFGESFKGPIVPFGALIEYHPISTRDQSRIHQFGNKVLPRIFLGYELVVWGIWKGDILISDLEGLEKLDASDTYPRRIKAKEILIRQKDDEFIFSLTDGSAKLSRRDYEFRESTLRREPTVRSEDFSRELQDELGESQPTETTDYAEARADFWSIQGEFICRHHNDPRVQLYVPKEETFPIPLKYIDVTRSTHTDLDVLQEKRIYDYWNVESSKHLSDSWRGFTKFTLLNEKSPKGFLWSGERLTQIQTTARPDHVWPEVWTNNGKAAQNRENRMGKRKTKARQCSKTDRIYFIDPDDQDYKETLKTASRKFDRPMAPPMPCKRKAQTSTTKVAAKHEAASQKIPKTVSGCIAECHESTRQRAVSSLPTKHEDHFAGKGFTWMTHYNLVHKFIPVPQAMKIQDAKAAVDKEWKKLETIPVWNLEKVKSKKEVILEAQRDKKKVHCATWMDVCHSKNAEFEPELQKYKGRVVLGG